MGGNLKGRWEAWKCQRGRGLETIYTQLTQLYFSLEVKNTTYAHSYVYYIVRKTWVVWE